MCVGENTSRPANVRVVRLQRATSALQQAAVLSKKWYTTFSIKLRPAAAHSLPAVGEQLARLQAEMCFRPRTCRGRKQLKNFVALVAKFCKTHFFTLDSEIALYFRKWKC